MSNNVITNSFKSIFIFLIASFWVLCSRTVIMAENTSTELNGTVYEFDNKSHYDADNAVLTDTAGTLGTICLTGDFTDNGEKAGFTSYLVSDGSIEISYAVDNSLLETEDTEWHISSYKNKKVDSITLAKNILSGALILQTSTDGETWITEDIENNTDIFNEGSELSSPFYSTIDIQLQNGCYYRVTIVYRLTRKTEDSSFLFINTDKYETKEVAEIFEFYASYEETGTSAEDSPRITLGSKTNAGKDTGYSEENAIDKNDPHYGWDIGSFFVNGYTRTTTDSGDDIVFLKNVGDKITLWFTLEQDISCLNGNDKLSVSDDTNGYDQYFEIEKTDFGKGTLIIRYTDEEGVKHDPIIYTNFLEAVTRTGADTKVQLFEEGDYEVALDYEITNKSGVLFSTTNYRISFSFSIRNGNCMVYPFDINTGSELADLAITENGFMLDMANSKYLNIDVEYSALTMGTDGQLVEDVRFNRPAKDGDEYTDEGIYTFTVSNQYTGSTTTKTIYVGTNPYLSALSRYEYSVEDLNTILSQGATISDNGELNTTTGQVELQSEITESEPQTEINSDEPSSEKVIEGVAEPNNETESQTNSDTPESKSTYLLIFVICILAVIIIIVVLKRRESNYNNVQEEKIR